MKLFAKQSSSGEERVFRSGVWSAAIAAAVIVLAVLVNLIVRAIPSRYTEFDLSEAGLYTLSESSRQVADDLTQDVTIYYLAQTGNEDQIISKLLDKYAAQSSHITWELKDPAVYPTFAAQYGAQDLTSGGLILVCGEQSKVLDAAELYDYDYSDYAATGAANVTFDGESRITSAIYQLTSGESRHVYYTTNHGEQALTSTLTDALESQNLTVSALDLLSQTIPEDCDLLVINDPAQDFSGAGSLVDELGQLRSYLSNGGRVLLLTDSYYSTPNLDAVMAEFGLTRTEGLVVEGDTNHYLNGYPALYLLPDYASTEESTALDGVNTSRRVLLQMAQGITLTETEHVVSDALLVSSDSAYSKPEGYEMTTTEKADGDIAGPFTLAAYARNEDTGAQVIWVNCGNMDNEGIYQVIPGNVTFLQGCAASLADGETVNLKANSEPAAESDSTAYQTVWRLAGDTAADLDETKVDAILSALCTYVSAQATDADPAAYGFEAPLVTAEVTTADGTINLTYAMGTDGCYLMVEGDSSVYTVDASVVSALLYPADQLKAE